DERADLPDPGLPPIADQQAADRVELARFGIVDAASRARELEALEVEGAAQPDIDQAGDAALQILGGGRLEHIDARQRLSREILNRDRPAIGGEYLAP